MTRNPISLWGGPPGPRGSPWTRSSSSEVNPIHRRKAVQGVRPTTSRNSEAYGVNLRWLTPNRLRIEYLESKTEGRSLAYADIAGERIQIEIKPGVLDPNAPAGGMAYNATHQKTS